jgi:hypothetical protein
MIDRTFSVLLDHDTMDLIYQKLLQSDINDSDLKRIRSSFLLSQLSYGVKGAFYDC